jgi:hypothetical protein
MSEQEESRVKSLTRREIKQIEPKIAEAIRRESFEDFKNILISLGIALGSERFRFLEGKFWNAVSERRRNKQQRP